jgi:DNA-binding transcriptional ArsR family regulator
MDDRSAELIAEHLRVLGQEMRIKLLARLHDGPATVQELTDSLSAVQQNISQHLSLMHKAGILERRKIGTRVFYELRETRSLAIVESTRLVVAERSSRLARLSQELAQDNLLTGTVK